VLLFVIDEVCHSVVYSVMVETLVAKYVVHSEVQLVVVLLFVIDEVCHSVVYSVMVETLVAK
jgi:hypothetical protein